MENEHIIEQLWLAETGSKNRREMASRILLFLCFVALLRPLWGVPFPRNDGKVWVYFETFFPFSAVSDLLTCGIKRCEVSPIYKSTFLSSWNAIDLLYHGFLRRSNFSQKLTRMHAYNVLYKSVRILFPILWPEFLCD